MWGCIAACFESNTSAVRFVAFPATEYDEVLSGYHQSTLRMRTEMVFETLVCSLLNHLTWLIARENFIIHQLVSRFCCVQKLQAVTLSNGGSVFEKCL
jgi:hypothetical protein